MNWFKLIISIIIPFIVAAIGGFSTASSVSTWYTTLNKPFFNPPSWVFGPTWTLLYLMMGISLYLVWSKTDSKLVFIVFGLQLTLNLLWSIFFFGMQNPMIAFIDIVLLLGAIIWTIIIFYPISSTAAYMMVPYLLWVFFASILNGAIWYLN